MSEKECTKCGEVKPFSEYSKCKGGRFGLHAKCKACFSEYMKEWRPRKTKIIYCSIKLQERECTKCGEIKDFDEYHKDKHSSTGFKPSCKQCAIKHRKKNAEILRQKGREYYARNVEKESLRKKEARKKHPERHKEARRKYEAKNPHAWTKAHNKRMATDPIYRLIRNMRCRTYHALAGKRKKDTTKKLLGCNLEQARQHIENQFTEGMSWDNYGTHGWHIDHIMPCASFNLTDPEEQRKCFHYTNLQPLWAEDNLKKSDTIPTEHQVKLL